MTRPSPDMESVVKFAWTVDAQVNDMADALRHLDVEDVSLPDALDARQSLAEAAIALGVVRESLDDKIGAAMGSYRVVVEGHGQIERHTKKSRTKWDREALLHDVLDTRLVDRETGELRDETPLDKVLTVWNLGAPRLVALRDRDLDPDEYAEVETRPGWTLRTF